MLDVLAGAALERLLDSIGTPAIMIRVEEDGGFRLLYPNKAWQEAAGIPAHALNGRRIEDALPRDLPEHRRAFLNQWRKCATTGETVEYQDLFPTPSGAKWWRIILTPVFDDQQRVVRLLQTTADITAEREAQDELRYQHLLQQTQLDLMPQGVMVVDTNGKVLQTNRRFREMWRISDDILGVGKMAALPAALVQLANPRAFRRLVDETNKDLHIEIDGMELALKDGRVFETHSRGMIDDNNIGRGRVWFFRDITEKKQNEQRLRKAHVLQRAMLDSASQIIISTDTNAVIQSFNAAAERLLGYAAEELVGKHSAYLLHDPAELEERRATTSRLLGREVTLAEMFSERVMAGLPLVQEWNFVRKDGSHLPVELTLTRLDDEEGNFLGFLGVATDISERKEAERRLLELATTDGLTRLWNRRHFLDQAEQALRHARRYGEAAVFALIDVDYFKRINDTYGHAVGDRVLAETATVMASALRDSDLICRWGGEEFAVMLVNTTPDMAMQVAERLRRMVESMTIMHENMPLPLSISIGQSNWLASEDDLDKVLLRADQALYDAKAGGRNRVRGVWLADELTGAAAMPKAQVPALSNDKVDSGA